MVRRSVSSVTSRAGEVMTSAKLYHFDIDHDRSWVNQKGAVTSRSCTRIPAELTSRSATSCGGVASPLRGEPRWFKEGNLAKKAVKRAVARRAVKKRAVKRAVKRRVVKKAVKRRAVKRAVVKRRVVKKAVKRRAVKRAVVKRAVVKRAIRRAVLAQLLTESGGVKE